MEGTSSEPQVRHSTRRDGRGGTAVDELRRRRDPKMEDCLSCLLGDLVGLFGSAAFSEMVASLADVGLRWSDEREVFNFVL